MRGTGHLVWRAALAIALMVCFYGLALAVVAVLLAVPIVLVRLSVGLVFKVGLFCLVGAYVILKSILPRWDRFDPPGPRLVPQEQPRLFAEVRRIAAEVRQAEPAEVYLVADVNAWVGQRGGIMGLGSRRVMALGLPLLQVLTVPELRAVVAHEFGHFDAGDVAIGPLVYRTRATLMRTVLELRQHSEALTTPFVWYAHLFFRVTHAVSRHQEVLADRVSVRVAGAEATASGLRATQHAALAFVPYWKGAVEPVLSAGYVPPLAAGFDTFLKAPWVVGKIKEALTEQARSGQRNPYDTHPPLPDRLAALGADPNETRRAAGPAALTLLDGLPALERQLVELAVRRRGGAASEDRIGLHLEPDQRSLTPIAWDEVGAKVWVPEWERFARRHAKALAGFTPASLPEADWEGIGRRLVAGQKNAKPLEAADSVVGVALALVLSRAGFRINSQPGSTHALTGLGEQVEVFHVRECLASGPDAAQAWKALCAHAGIGDMDLGSAGGDTPRSRSH